MIPAFWSLRPKPFTSTVKALRITTAHSPTRSTARYRPRGGRLPGTGCEPCFFLEPAAGFEPATSGLQVRCSTAELHRLGPLLYTTELLAEKRGWHGRYRTHDLAVNSRLLCQLSYMPTRKEAVRSRRNPRRQPPCLLNQILPPKTISGTAYTSCCHRNH